MATTRIKAKAIPHRVPQSRDACAGDIAELGILQRQLQGVTAEINDEIARITTARQPTIDDLTQRIDALRGGIQTWCEAHRTDLLGPGDSRGKTASLVTGEVSWRIRPPSVAVRGVDTVLETLHKLGLGRFVRMKEEIDKQAVLADPKPVSNIPGLSIVSGVEDFVVTPFEVEVQS